MLLNGKGRINCTIYEVALVLRGDQNPEQRPKIIFLSQFLIICVLTVSFNGP